MAHAKWSASLETGNPVVDDEHRRTFDLVNDLHDGISAKLPRAEQERILDDILEHVATHFHNEEALMRDVHYPDLKTQKRLHKEFFAEVGRLAREYRARENSTLIAIEIYIYRWLLTHIRTEDRKIAEYIRDRAISE